VPRFAANLTMLYNEHPFSDRFAAAARDGFEAVEFLFPYDFRPNIIKAQLDAHKLTQVLFNAPPGDWGAGERGIASLPGREDEFRRSIDTALQYARVIGTRKLHVMAGLIGSDQSREQHLDVYRTNLEFAAMASAAENLTVLIEPINTCDMPGYFLNRQDEAQAICAEVGAVNLKVQFDCYHCQLVEGEVAALLKQDIEGIGHIQIAGAPGRHEPDTGELDYAPLFALIDDLGYDSYIGCEYKPKTKTSEGLGWLKPYLHTTSKLAR
jgi:2-dehydrotetronate isomerase